jgi:hypothetical protein
MARPRNYTDEQLTYIKQYWRKYPTKLVAEQLGMTTRRVDAIAHYHGLVKNLNKSRKPLPEFWTPIDIPHEWEFKHWTQKKIDAARKCAMDEAGLITGHPPLVTGIYPSYDGLTPAGIDVVSLKPRKNWLQRLVSWFLTGEA